MVAAGGHRTKTRLQLRRVGPCLERCRMIDLSWSHNYLPEVRVQWGSLCLVFTARHLTCFGLYVPGVQASRLVICLITTSVCTVNRQIMYGFLSIPAWLHESWHLTVRELTLVCGRVTVDTMVFDHAIDIQWFDRVQVDIASSDQVNLTFMQLMTDLTLDYTIWHWDIWLKQFAMSVLTCQFTMSSVKLRNFSRPRVCYCY